MYAVFQRSSKSKTKVIATATSIMANTLAAKDEVQQHNFKEVTTHSYTDKKAERLRSRQANQTLKLSRRWLWKSY